jgi:hypothetical protein
MVRSLCKSGHRIQPHLLPGRPGCSLPRPAPLHPNWRGRLARIWPRPPSRLPSTCGKHSPTPTQGQGQGAEVRWGAVAPQPPAGGAPRGGRPRRGRAGRRARPGVLRGGGEGGAVPRWYWRDSMSADAGGHCPLSPEHLAATARLAQPGRTSGRQRRRSPGGMALRASAAAARTAGARGSSARAGRRIPSSVAAGGKAPTNLR